MIYTATCGNSAPSTSTLQEESDEPFQSQCFYDRGSSLGHRDPGDLGGDRDPAVRGEAEHRAPEPANRHGLVVRAEQRQDGASGRLLHREASVQDRVRGDVQLQHLQDQQGHGRQRPDDHAELRRQGACSLLTGSAHQRTAHWRVRVSDRQKGRTELRLHQDRLREAGTAAGKVTSPWRSDSRRTPTLEKGGCFYFQISLTTFPAHANIYPRLAKRSSHVSDKEDVMHTLRPEQERGLKLIEVIVMIAIIALVIAACWSKH